MTFFDDHDPPPRPKRERQPVWADAPAGVLPALSVQRAVLLRSSRAALVVDRFLVYPNGVVFTLATYTSQARTRSFGEPPFPIYRPGAELTDDSIRFGIEFADGAKWTNLQPNFPRPGEDPVGPLVLGPSGGSSNDTTWEMRYWLWPLPPPGKISFLASWPSEGLEESIVDLDATEFRARAAQAEVLWDHE